MGWIQEEKWDVLILAVIISYFLIGAFINFIIFLLAKIREEDERYEIWDPVLNTIPGFINFVFVYSLLWLPVMIPFVLNRKQKQGNRQKSKWVYFIKHPIQAYKDWFMKRYYQ
ncbi:amino acid transporter [Evansella vedderi]|uniref:Amino acid transporter n=1 Tax=Evansella vedderi TaxID=38282 RepID=A0ABT9ZW56_9BACI|nr:hypothetical protein [Evansella vedderi]MDQ0255467.1 amino acid transporter [Evansella vedderi]